MFTTNLKWKGGISEPSTVLLITLTNFYTLLGTHISTQKLHFLKMIVLFPKVGYVFIPLEGRYFASMTRIIHASLFNRQGAEDLVEEKHVKNVLGFHEECFFVKKTPSNQRENGQPWVLQTKTYMYPHWVQDTSTHLYSQDSKYTPFFYSWFKWSHSKLIEIFELQVHVVIHQLCQFWTNSFSGVDYPPRNLKNWWLEDDPFLLRCPSLSGCELGRLFRQRLEGLERDQNGNAAACVTFFLWIPGKNYDSWDETWPIGSMYGIFTYICHKYQPNVGKCTIHGLFLKNMNVKMGSSSTTRGENSKKNIWKHHLGLYGFMRWNMMKLNTFIDFRVVSSFIFGA